MLCILTGCQYVFTDQQERPTVEIHTASYDMQRELLISLDRSLQKWTSFRVLNTGASQVLKVDILDISYEDVGYLYDSTPQTQQLEDRLFPNEGRIVVKANVSLIDKLDQNRMIEHRQVVASADYDFTNPNVLSQTSYQNVPLVEYSLGQFDAQYAANDIAKKIAINKLAEKIALILSAECRKS